MACATRITIETGWEIELIAGFRFIGVVGSATKQASLAVASDTRLNSCATLTLGNAKETALWFNPVYGDLYLLQELPESSGNLLP